MKRFDDHEPCPKCGSTEKTVEFMNLKKKPESIKMASISLVARIAAAGHNEVLDVECRRCGYMFGLRLPLDAPEAPE